MRIALAAMPVINRDVQHNLQTIVQTSANLTGKADLVLFGESALQGFEAFTWDYTQDCSMALTTDDPTIRRICAVAREAAIAISFGYLERSGEQLHSSQLFVGANGEIVQNFHRVSPGWKEPVADHHYVEGEGFCPFTYLGKRLSIGLCGDLWTPGKPEEMLGLHTDAVLWPVYCDYTPEEWNTGIKQEYAQQAKLCGQNVLLVNPVCLSPAASGTALASGGAVWFREGQIVQELPAGGEGVLVVEI